MADVTRGDKSEPKRSKDQAKKSGEKTRRASGSSGSVSAKYRGTVDLPMYVDTARLRFNVDRGGRTLLIAGPMKGYCSMGSNRCGNGDEAIAADRLRQLNNNDEDSRRIGGQGDQSLSVDDLRQPCPPTEPWNARAGFCGTTDGCCGVSGRRLSSGSRLTGDGQSSGLVGRPVDGWCCRADQRQRVDYVVDPSPTGAYSAIGAPASLLLPPHGLAASYSKSWPNLRDAPFD